MLISLAAWFAERPDEFASPHIAGIAEGTFVLRVAQGARADVEESEHGLAPEFADKMAPRG
jgi:hypothetical protein